MNEYISKGNAIFAVSALPLTLDAETTQRAIEAVRHVPAADVVEVVHCKDCRDCMEFTPEYKEKSGHYGTCRRLLIPMLDDNDARIKADDYCSYGERKEDET